jgi:hypothetical protein
MDRELIAIALKVGKRADDMAKRGRFLGDGSEEALRYTFCALDALDAPGAKIDARSKEPRP